jgi:integrase
MGSVYQRKTARGVMYGIDYRLASGRRIREIISADKKQAEQVLAQRWADVVSGRHGLPVSRSHTVRVESTDLLKVHGPMLGPRTRESYEMVIRCHLDPYLGDTPLGALTTQQILAYRAARLDEAEKLQIIRDRELERRRKRRPGKRIPLPRPLSPTSINYHVTVLSAMLKAAVAAGRIPRNPAQGIKKLPTGHNREDDMQVLDPTQVRAFLEVATDELRPMFTTAVFTGLRIGELLALQWDDVDLEGSVLTVRRARRRVRKAEGGYESKDGQPKSKKSRRVDLSRDVVAVLRTLPSRFASGRVFCRRGQPYDPNNLVNRDFRRTLRRAGCPRIRFHDLRHTYAALLIAAGAHPKYIQAQLGHASITTTLNTYGHLLPKEFRGEGDRLSQLVSGTGVTADSSPVRKRGHQMGTVPESLIVNRAESLA